jgi:hypothetical protein
MDVQAAHHILDSFIIATAGAGRLVAQAAAQARESISFVNQLREPAS